jgi:methanethiol S-methyltransferase
VGATLSTSAHGRAFAAIGGVLFVASLLYFLVRYCDFGMPIGPWTPEQWTAVAWDAGLFSLFALHHTVFARTSTKVVIKSRVSPAFERSTYVWLASLLFGLTLWAWSPVGGTLWDVDGAWQWTLNAGRVAGLVLTVLAASAIDPLELAGIRQAFNWPLRNDRPLMTTGVYGLVRHPIYLGWVLLVWSVPLMTGTRVVFAAISTFYLVVAVPFEEREMRRTMGAAYEDYSRLVRWRMLPGVY